MRRDQHIGKLSDIPGARIRLALSSGTNSGRRPSAGASPKTPRERASRSVKQKTRQQSQIIPR